MKGIDFVKNLVKYCIPSLISAIVGILVIPLITNSYPSYEYGKINLFYSIANTLFLFVVLGLDSAYFRFFYELPVGYTRQRLFKLSIIVGVVNTFVLFIICRYFFQNEVTEYLFGEHKTDLLLGMYIYIIGLIFLKFVGYELRMKDKAKMYNLVQIIYILTNRVLFVAFVPISTSYVYGNWITAISTFLFGIMFLYWIEKDHFYLENPKYLFSQGTKEIFKFSIPLMPTTLMVWMNNSVAKFIYSYFGDYTAIGTFSIATSVANIFSIVPAAFTTYWSPFIYKNYKTNHNLIKKVHDYIVFSCLLLFLLFFIFQDIIYLFVGGDYKVTKSFFLLVMLNPVQSLICETTSYGIMFEKKTKFNLYTSIIAFVANVVITFISYKAFGEIGAAFGVAMSAIIQLILKTLIGQYYYKTVISPFRTIIGISLIIFLSVVNIFIYSEIYMKIGIAFIVFITGMFLYKNNFNEVKNTVKLIIRNRK
jgi:Membrane protein involved in the export of O-antigen and teichoic acid